MTLEGRVEKLSHAAVKKLSVRDDSVGVYRKGEGPRQKTLRLFEIKDDSGDILVRVGEGPSVPFDFYRMSGWTVGLFARERGYRLRTNK